MTRTDAVDTALRSAVASVFETLEARRLLAAPEIGPLPFEPEAVAGHPIYLPLQISDADGDAVDDLTVSVVETPGEEANGSAEVLPRENRFLEMDVAGPDFSGTMTFQLFDNVAPETTSRIAALADTGFYDGLEIFRVIDDFILQFGDPANDGTGVLDPDGEPNTGDERRSPEFTFEDEFDPDSLFTGDGQLAMANSGKDTNGSQFFVTEGPVRNLDFNHTIFGQLISGFDVRDAVIESPTGVDDEGNQTQRPAETITVTGVRTVENQTDGVARFLPSAPGDYTLRVTAVDDNGEQSTRDLTVSVGPDVAGDGEDFDDPPFLLLQSDLSLLTDVGQAITFDLPATDVDGDPLAYYASFVDFTAGVEQNAQFRQILNEVFTTGQNPATGQNLVTNGPAGNLDVSQEDARVTYTPADGFAGPVQVFVYTVQQGFNATNVNSQIDKQLVLIGVGDDAASGTGQTVLATEGQELDDVAVARFLDQAGEDAEADDWSAVIDWGDGEVTDGEVVALDDEGAFEVRGDHTYETLDGDVPLRVTIVGDRGARLELVGEVDGVGPVSLDPENRALRVDGTEADDQISLERDGDMLIVTVNGEETEVDANDVDLIELFGGDGDDEIVVGQDGPNTRVFAGAGNDSVTGGGGNDEIFGEAGDDELDGRGGNDMMDGGDGADYLMGGTDLGDIDDEIVEAGFYDRDTLIGGDGDDTLSGGRDANDLRGGPGDDLLNGSGSRDTLDGGEGNDRLRGFGNDDLLQGGEGGDVLLGDALEGERGGEDNGGDDTLEGGAGDDVLLGYFGDDLFRGGLGADGLFGGDGIDTDDEDDENDIVDDEVENRG